MASTYSASLSAAIDEFLQQDEAPLYPGELTSMVARAIDQQHIFLQAAQRFGTPQYMLEEERLTAQIQRFRAAFAHPRQHTWVHYAFKANPTLPVVRRIRAAGLAADVSSGMELELAIRCGFDRIVFSGPAKTDDELELALRHAGRVTVHLDSFLELERLAARAAARGISVNAGIRLSLQSHGAWTKFGIPAEQLPTFVERSRKLQHVRVQGVQFHLSWNRQAEGYCQTLERLGPLLRAQAPAGGWHFVDIGGGYYPEDDEAVYPWLTPRGRIRAMLGLQPAEGPPDDWDLRYLLHPVQPVETMAARIHQAFDRHIVACLGPVDLWLEPGRYLVNQAVHLLLQVADIKGPEVAITDGGTHLLGWERLETEHVPLINLSQPGSAQRRCRVFGSLCTPHDVWGYTYYGRGIDVGDVLLLPAQGAYVQTLAQRFIKPLCQTTVLQTSGTLRREESTETFARRYPRCSGRRSTDGCSGNRDTA